MSLSLSLLFVDSTPFSVNLVNLSLLYFVSICIIIVIPLSHYILFSILNHHYSSLPSSSSPFPGRTNNVNWLLYSYSSSFVIYILFSFSFLSFFLSRSSLPFRSSPRTHYPSASISSPLIHFGSHANQIVSICRKP